MGKMNLRTPGTASFLCIGHPHRHLLQWYEGFLFKIFISEINLKIVLIYLLMKLARGVGLSEKSNSGSWRVSINCANKFYLFSS